MFARFCEYTKTQWIIYFKKVNFMVVNDILTELLLKQNNDNKKMLFQFGKDSKTQ